MSKHGRVLVAMSGGIDSTVTAMMMHEQGYEVVGVTMKTWDYANATGFPALSLADLANTDSRDTNSIMKFLHGVETDETNL